MSVEFRKEESDPVSSAPLTINFSYPSITTLIKFLSPSELFQELQNYPGKTVFLVDKNFFSLYRQLLKPFLDNYPFLLITALEEKKNLDTLQIIIDFLADNRVTRDTDIIAIGGGITLDTVALAASLYKRGCPLVFVPTTFLSMIDAAFGGKTGINHLGFKNLIGTFYPAGKVFIVRDFLETLETIDIMNGWAECIKVSLLAPNKLYDQIIIKKGSITSDIICLAIQEKLRFCLSDLTDSGERQKLNLGHTFAHLIESASGYEVSHGMAVALGIRAVTRYCMEKGLIDRDTSTRINQPLDLLGFPQRLDDRYHETLKRDGLKLLSMDKKQRETGVIIIFKAFQVTSLYSYDDQQELLHCLLSL